MAWLLCDYLTRFSPGVNGWTLQWRAVKWKASLVVAGLVHWLWNWYVSVVEKGTDLRCYQKKKKKGKYWRTCLIVGFLPLIGNRFRDVSVRIFDTAHFKKGSPAGIWQPGVNLNLSSCCLLKCPRGPHRLDATVESRCFLSPSEGTWDCPQPNEDAAAAHPADTGGSPSPTDLPSAHRPRGPPGSRRAGRGEQAVPALPGGSSGLAAASRAGSR